MGEGEGGTPCNFQHIFDFGIINNFAKPKIYQPK